MGKRHGILRCSHCGLWRSWYSWKGSPRIDRNCIKCGKRIVVSVDRKPGGRGRKQKTLVKEFPGHMPYTSIIKALRAHNKFERQGGRKSWILRGGSEGFVRGSRITPKYATRKIRKTIKNMTIEEWDALSEKILEEVE